MRIGIISDSHGNTHALKRAIHLMGHIDMLIHLGDLYSDIKAIESDTDVKIETVHGNNDYSKDNSYEKVLNINGKRIFITHGHKYNVSFGLDRLYYRALEVEADIALFGHTHRQVTERCGNVIMVNPGSITLPRDGIHGYAILSILENGEINIEQRHINQQI